MTHKKIKILPKKEKYHFFKQTKEKTRSLFFKRKEYFFVKRGIKYEKIKKD